MKLGGNSLLEMLQEIEEQTENDENVETINYNNPDGIVNFIVEDLIKVSKIEGYEYIKHKPPKINIWNKYDLTT